MRRKTQLKIDQKEKDAENKFQDNKVIEYYWLLGVITLKLYEPSVYKMSNNKVSCLIHSSRVILSPSNGLFGTMLPTMLTVSACKSAGKTGIWKQTKQVKKLIFYFGDILDSM
jgi:hypothetical protein